MAVRGESLSERFMKLYNFLPLEERKLTVIVIDNEPMNWAKVHEEVKNNTDSSKRILKKLNEKGII